MVGSLLSVITLMWYVLVTKLWLALSSRGGLLPSCGIRISYEAMVTGNKWLSPLGGRLLP